MQALNGDKALI
jgi:chromosome segregation ATPase